MESQKLSAARAYERANKELIPPIARPRFHLTPYLGWMNDPNGLSFYKGQYHMFYQYNPFGTVWDSMHWGHAVSSDLLQWTHLPVALAPDQPYDSFGCFSGSAIETQDGKHLLLYTGVCKDTGDLGVDIQTQCVAVGNGLEYQKYALNPVIDEHLLPPGLNRSHFRDPKIWREADGNLRCVVGSCNEQGLGRILLFSSSDGLSWRFEGILCENTGRLGRMWECPDFFTLGGKHVLLCSPMDMLPEGFEYHNGNGTVCMIGRYSEDQKRFYPESDQAIDYGIDFYAPQTIETPDGRRVMIGWMQNWDTCALSRDETRPWFGQMSLPRELSIYNGRLYQQPIRELDLYKSGKIEHVNVRFQDELRLDGVEGRMVDLELDIRPIEGENLYQKFTLLFAQDENYHTGLSYRTDESVLKIDRKFSGSRRAYIHQRRSLIPNRNGRIKLRVILDRYSAEVFVNDGEQVLSATIMTDISAKGISFFAEGIVEMDVRKYDLFSER